MAFGYVVAQINVTDPETYAGYIKLVLPTIQHFGGGETVAVTNRTSVHTPLVQVVSDLPSIPSAGTFA